jgi:hypothetical protein
MPNPGLDWRSPAGVLPGTLSEVWFEPDPPVEIKDLQR